MVDPGDPYGSGGEVIDGVDPYGPPITVDPYKRSGGDYGGGGDW
jgi:hypothetical protein